MSASHLFIWSGIIILAASSCIIAAYVRRLWLDGAVLCERIDRVLAQFLAAQANQGMIDSNFETRISSLKAWADSYAAFHEHASKQQSSRVDDLNSRLIQLETENKTIAPAKSDEDEDPFAGPRSWSAQAAAAERGAGVRSKNA